ncbi:metallophosphoesterase family protein [Bradyrhizobium canariense]|uniref:3',5'-cyclic AMP phosphodiesterase CpdA n=1 Tax=Bradyrhizobium canariense TaxID=255045 RepID=A0A1H1WR23_9BRAD|nr:metallophosphoesterase [Bradyrhizobium canariense]SDS99100.1 3',5'-cyclic AMP phosphodiesterase CpdA [Bradyrhizobium canariense]
MLRPQTCRMTFAVIGDTHVKPESGDQSAPWKVNEAATARARWVSREIERYRPDFIVHLGDLVHPVPELSTFGEAVELTRQIFQPFHNRLHIIPGNHDIGDKPNRAMPAKMVRDEWIELHEKNFGPSYFFFDRDDCRFIFVNDPVMNSKSAIEVRQRAWLEQTLGSADGRRIFMFMHYPLFLLDPKEPSNYDNIDEPARTDILGLIREHKVEAVFAGHVHNIFYHRVDGTEFYVMPATSFVRQDYSEFFRTDAIHENGRNDAEKLGFSIVEVHDDGHVVHYLRSYGATLDAANAGSAVATRSASMQLPNPKKAGGAPFGVFLRHPWAEITSLPNNGPMDEFLRKDARNDYHLAAMWRMGIRHARVPLSDILDDRVSARMADLVAVGHSFTIFGFGIPEDRTLKLLKSRAHLIGRYECVLPADEIERDAAKVAAFRHELGCPVLVSPIATSAAEKKVGSRIELFVSHGFRPNQLDEIERLLAATNRGDLNHLVVRVGLSADILATADELASWQARSGCRLDLHLRIAADNPATNIVDDAAILGGIVTFHLAALAHPELAMFIDTFMDIDRGYFVRNGLIDRRCNLRPAGLAVETLAAYLAGPAEVARLQTSGGNAFTCRMPDRSALVLLPEAGARMLVTPAMLDGLGLDEDALTIRLDRPWTIDPGLGLELKGGGSVPTETTRPIMIIGLKVQ